MIAVVFVYSILLYDSDFDLITKTESIGLLEQNLFLGKTGTKRVILHVSRKNALKSLMKITT